MAACSAHKTLPVLTGGAWLQINDSRYLEGVKEAMSLFGSTSPSYPVMASLDLCRAWLEEEGQKAFRNTGTPGWGGEEAGGGKGPRVYRRA